MQRNDWIQVRTRAPEVIRECVVELSQACTHFRPETLAARVTRLEEDRHALEFEPPLSACQFTSLLGALVDVPEVVEARGWIDGAEGMRYQLRADSKRIVNGSTQFLLGCTEHGEQLEVYIPERWMCARSHGSEEFEEPATSSATDGRIRWTVVMDGMREPRLMKTHPPDFDWGGADPD